MGTVSHVYTLGMSLAGCRYDLRINDVPIFRDVAEGHALTATMAINEYLVPGPNRLTASLRPRPGREELDRPAETFTLSLLGRAAGEPKTANQLLARIDLRPQGDPGQLASLAGDGFGLLTVNPSLGLAGDGRQALDVAFDFAPSGPCHSWAWQTSPPIENSPRTRDSLRALFAGWTERLRGGDAGWLLTAMGERNRELSQALFEPPAALEAHGLLEAVADPALSLYDPELEHSELMVFAGGRLAQLVRWNGSPVIVYLEPDGENARLYPFTFRQGPSGWIVCR